MHRLLYTLLLSGALLPTLASAQFPTAQFDAAEYTVQETAGSVILTVTISGPGFGGLIYRTEDETATAGEDYESQFDFLGWNGGDSSPKQIEIPITADELEEGEETFLVILENGDGVDPGEPSTARVRIVESGAEPLAYWVLDPAIPTDPNGAYNVLYEGGIDAQVTMRLNEFPVEPVGVQWVLEPDGTPQEVVFDGTQEMQIEFSSPPAPAGGGLVQRTLRILSGAKRVAKIFGPENYQGWFEFIDDLHGDPCSYCAVNLILSRWGFVNCSSTCALVFGSECSLKRSASDADILRRYRDEILNTTLGGQHYVDLYGEVSNPIIPALARDPILIYDILRAQDAWIDAIEALVEGDGDSAVVTATMRDDLVGITNRLIALGDPGADALAEELARLTAVDIAGMSMSQFQSHVDATGHAVPAATQSFGQIKGRY